MTGLPMEVWKVRLILCLGLVASVVFWSQVLPVTLAAPAPYQFGLTVDGPRRIQLRDRNGAPLPGGEFYVPKGARVGVWTRSEPAPVPPRPGERLSIHIERAPPAADLGPQVTRVVRTGGTVLIHGMGFGSKRGPSSAVWWNAVPATVLSWSETTIRARLPAGKWKGKPVLFVRNAEGRYRQGVVP